MQSYLSIGCLLFIFSTLGATLVHGDPEPMARPTRPKVFTSPEELRRYLDLVRDYYSLNGKARYGKRGDVLPAMPDKDHPWDALRMILDVRRQMQQQRQQQQRQKFEKSDEEKDQFLQDFQISGGGKHAAKFDARPPYLLDVVGKYYDDTQ